MALVTISRRQSVWVLQAVYFSVAVLLTAFAIVTFDSQNIFGEALAYVAAFFGLLLWVGAVAMLNARFGWVVVE